MRREETNEIRTSVKYKPIGSRPRGRQETMDGWSVPRSRETI